MVKVCTVCGDRGFTDLLVTCNQCNDLAEHVYCMQTLSDYAPDADWSCVECKLKQKASTQKIALMPSHPITKQSQAESNKRQIEDTISIPVSKKRAVESSNVESLLERDSSLVTLEADKGDICAVSQQIDISLHSRDGLPKVPQTGKFDCGSTTLLQDNGSSQRSLCKDNSSNILCCQQSSSSMAQVSSALTSSGSKRQLLDKSQDPLPQFLLSSRPAASARGQRTFKGSKEIGSGSGNSSSHDKFSDLRGTLEHKKKLKDLVPDISRKDMEITKNIAKLIKGGTDGSELGKNPKESTSLGMEKEDCKGIMPKVKSTGSSSKKLKLDKNDCNDPISRDDVFKRSKSVHDDCQTLASRNGVCLPITEGQSNMASVEKALTKTLHCQNINQPSTVYLPDTVASFSDKLNSGENKSTITKHDIDKVVSCSADKAFQEKQNNVNEQAHKSDNSTIQLKTLPLYGEGNKLDANPGALHDGARTPSNGHPEALFNTTANCLKPGATIPAPINFSQERGPSAEMAHSMTRSLEINLSSSSAMQNDPSYVGERAGMPGSFPSSMDSSSPTHLPHQKPLTVPQSRFLWKGAFKVMGSVSGHCIYDGIQAHPSNTASPKVYEMTKKFTPQLHLEQVQRCNIWPKRFHKDPPTDDNIGLYFFPTDDERCEKSYAKLLKEANDHDLAMRMYLDSAELLIFSSIQLPERFQSIRGKFYFWGVFRGRGNGPSVCKVQEILSPSKHVGANVLQADSSVLSVTRVLMLPDMRKHGVGEECTKIDTKGQNRKHDIGSDYQEFSLGFHSTCSSALPPSSDHLLEKQGFEHFQAEPDRKSEAEKEMVLRSHPHAYLSRQEGSCRKHGDGPHNSHQSSFSSGQSDRSSGSKERSVSPLALGRKKGNRCENSININRIRIFKESHIHMQTRREEEMKETVREHAKVRTGRHREKWSHRPRINFRKTGQMEHQRRKHDDVNNRDGSRSLFCSQSRSSRSRSESQSQLYKRSYSLSVGKPWSPDAGIVVPCHTVNSPDSYLHKSSRHEKLLLQRDSSSEVQIDNRNYNEKGSAVVGGDNCRKGEKETYSKKRVEGMSLLDVEEGFSVRSPEGSAGQDRSAGQDQPTKDQWSFTPLQNVTDEATEKCNVSEVSNAASLLDSRDSMCSGENVPHELTEADLSGVVNPRTEYVPGAGDQYPVTEQGRWYTCSSSEQTDSEPVPCLELFPLEEENLGVAKNVVNNWDIDLELGLGRSSSKKRLPPPSVRTFDDFPDDLLIYVLARVSSRAECPADFFNVLLTCKRFYYLGLHPPVLSTASTGALAAKASSWSSGAHKFRKQCADAGNTNAYGFQSLEFACLRASTSKITSCDFSSDGKLLANAGHEKKVVVWNLDSLKVKSILEEHSFLVTDVRFSTDSMHLATSSFDRTVKVWDVDNPKYSLCTFTGHLGTVMSLDFHPSNEDLVCSCDGESEIRYWSVSQGVCTRKFKGGTSQVRFQPCLGLFLAAADENVVRTFDVETGSCLHSLRGHIKPVHSVCWDASGNYLASVSEDSVRVWNVGSRGDECVQMLTCIEDKFHSCVYHPEYHSVLVIGCSKTLELWNVAENRSMTIPAHKGLITALAASEVTGIVVSASHDKTLKLWK